MLNRLIIFSVLVVIHNQAFAGFQTPSQSVSIEGKPIYYHFLSASGSQPVNTDMTASDGVNTGQKQNQQPIVMLLGGGPGFSSWNLQPIQQRLQTMGFDTLLMDMAGIGENRLAIEALSSVEILPIWNRQIHHVLQQVSLDRPVYLVGHSWGALMAMLYQRQHPQQVEKVVLLNPVDPEKRAMQHLTDEISIRNASEMGLQWDDESNWAQNTQVAEGDIERITLKQIQQVLPTYFMDYQQGQAYAAQFGIEDFNIDLNIKAWKEYDQQPIEYIGLRELNTPLYFLECRQDYLMPYNWNAMSAQLEFKQAVFLEGCGHFPWIEQEARFYSALEEMLDESI